MAQSTTPCKSNNKLEGKVAIITGGASGIGETTAYLFASHGARAIVIADIQDEKGEKLASSIGLHRCTYIHCDVANENQIKSLVDATLKLYGHLHIMFCNAGIFSERLQPILDFNMEAYEKLFSVNVGGVAASLKHAALAMVERNIRGSIVCTASVKGSAGSDKYTDYSMSKHAVLGLVRSASRQLGRHGIRVNSVSPGPLATGMSCGVLGMGVDEVEKMIEGCSWLNGVLKTKHVSDAVVFLASDESEFVTGHDLVVDGGNL